MLSTLELCHPLCHPLTSRELVSLLRIATSLETLVTHLPMSADSEGLLQLACCLRSNIPPLLPNLRKLHFFVVKKLRSKELLSGGPTDRRSNRGAYPDR
jgi:hypothetical protein